MYAKLTEGINYEWHSYVIIIIIIIIISNINNNNNQCGLKHLEPFASFLQSYNVTAIRHILSVTLSRFVTVFIMG